MPADALETPLERVLGAKTARALTRAYEVRTVGDLLSLFPRRYAHRGELTPIRFLHPGEQVTIVAEVVETREREMRARHGKITEARITDGQGFLTLTFFNQPWRAAELQPGARGVFSGRIGEYRGSLQLAHPDYELFAAEPAAGTDRRRDTADRDHGDASEASDAPVVDEAADDQADAWARQPLPIYPATSTLPSWKTANSIGIVLDGLADLPELLPEAVRRRHRLLDRRAAFEAVHRPKDDAQLRVGLRSARFEEAYVLQTALLRQRAELETQHAEAFPHVPGGMLDELDRILPFDLTAGQRAVGETISAELSQGSPMNRLLQGEVGSGKTLVALRAMLQAADGAGQAALIAPTEVLATQHLASLHGMLGHELWQRLMPQLITGSLPTAQRRHAALAVASGRSRLIVGTHALLSDSTQFENLALVVVDEQHRFGVEQREALKAKGVHHPHVLMLTATPIPRTVAMTVFGDLDISSLHELPAGRRPVASFVVPLAEKPAWIERVWQRLAEEVEKGRQGYIVAPLIDDAEAAAPGAVGASGTGTAVGASGVPAQRWSVDRVLRVLAEHPATRHLRVAALHGRMKPEEREQVMRDYVERRLDVLVATTVIEVGVNVPNASAMVVFDADRFGVAQLHQLRGRVGRGEHPSLALFVTTAAEGTPTRARIDAVANTTDGFELAELDLSLRREGDVLGATQSGSRSQLRALQVTRDAKIIEQARQAAHEQLQTGEPLPEALERAIRAAVAETDEHYLSAS
ncbi:ATP-dependent DNA helicase RecG [Pseudoclavibacter sp. CFCC 13611]|uniref:ATP-dependent DNA helicase RecG n=1 Tax=Pseudoclavibacter sp. CFCC 13611 TaxID=2615178 RepID=UPI0013011DF6|nr:ATP-dependent DNA helicase RecG [Pseudoclavibacter sp. CFCC 13611]KAB1664377.1 ATP-dependent DNA helicase RecG [Pseudoclavibacter sp. CFCC 13611]